jgi:integrase/recombinase XerD
VDGLVEEFAGYLVSERGMAGSTVERYRKVAVSFLAWRSSRPGVDGLGELTAGELSAFVLLESERLGAGSLNNVVTALRALCRFLHVRGLAPTGLAESVPTGPGWRRGSLGRTLDSGEVARLLDACDRCQPAGLRDYAMVVLLVRLGLRAREVATLRLDDVDWRHGEILVRGKGGRDERLPLPVDVGQALAGYCRRGRPRQPGRELFLQARAPYGPASRDVVSEVVRRACRRAGLPCIGAHRLRHTAATAMRRGGAPLAEIGRVLRHRFVATTAIYASVGTDELRELAREWPGGVA